MDIGSGSGFPSATLSNLRTPFCNRWSRVQLYGGISLISQILQSGNAKGSL